MNWTREEIIEDYVTITKKITTLQNNYEKKKEKVSFQEILAMSKKYEALFQNNQHQKIKPYLTEELLKNEKKPLRRQEMVLENYIYIRKAIIVNRVILTFMSRRNIAKSADIKSLRHCFLSRPPEHA